MERKNTSSSGEGSKREPYEPPRIVYREPLEAVAVACTTAGAKGNPGACPIGPISS
ncbi:MAG: hypothetical protein OEN21_04565 [Myxococcales bacterium]|nr:hypothetical protein [Myxococcales bacterium]